MDLSVSAPCQKVTYVGYTWFMWTLLTILPHSGSGSCVEYEEVVNGSGHRLRTCPLDHPPTYVYCCVDTCCEEPHLAILLTSIIGGVVISIIGVGLIAMCIIDMHRITCQDNRDLESPLISDEEDDFVDDAKLPSGGKWCKHKVMGAPPGEKCPRRSCDQSAADDTCEGVTSAALEAGMTSHTEVTTIAGSPMDNMAITEDEEEDGRV